jgi:acyl-CoA thioesterase
MIEASAPFDEMYDVQPVAPALFAADFPDGWQQGRGLYGGLVTAALIRALERSSPARPLRSLTAALCGPVLPGHAELRVEPLRVGSAVSTVAVRLVQGGEVQAHAVGVLGGARRDVVDRTRLPSPGPAAWRGVEVVQVEPPVGPAFARFFEYRTTRFPFAGETEARAEGWVRPLNAGPSRGAAFLAGCIDAYWPAEYVVFPAPRPMATIAFTFQPLGTFEGLDPEAPMYFRSELAASRAGYGVEFRELWGADGRLLALNQQTICVIK